QTDQPYREFLTFIHNLVSTSFKWTPHAKAHSNTEGAEKFALTLKWARAYFKMDYFNGVRSHGTSWSLSRGRSCRLECVTGRTGF
ncbi:hypothetical protein, partial [Rhizobium leguminosarum]|uniref:hypothetical protein n=1 Tax=Rhizobium leguminosarum TaxID=384 RepID=UPI001C900F80